MVGVVELFHLLGMAFGAVLGGDDYRDHEIFVADGVGIAFVGLMAFITADIRAVVLGAAPLLIQPGVLLGVAGGAGGALLAHAVERLGDLRRGAVAFRHLRRHRADAGGYGLIGRLDIAG